MASPLEAILTLETLDTDLFRSQVHCENFRKHLFGGQVLGQALMASYLTQDGELPNSLHAYFLRAGSSDIPVIYDVEKVREGRSFISRRAVARQFGRPIFNLSASFHKHERGYEHQIPFPENLPDPDTLIAERQEQSGKPIQAFEQDNSITPFHFIPIDEEALSRKIIEPPLTWFWIKSIERLPDDPILHYCSLAFASDLGLLATALLPHKANVFDKSLIAASVDHAMWFHSQDFRIDEWLLYQTFSPWAGNARGFTQGNIFNAQGKLIASTAQEGLIRPI